MSSRGCFTPPAQSLSHTIIARTEGYTYATKVCALCIVQESFSVAPCPNPTPPKSTPLTHERESGGARRGRWARTGTWCLRGVWM
jgi:hypothetical protein